MRDIAHFLEHQCVCVCVCVCVCACVCVMCVCVSTFRSVDSYSCQFSYKDMQNSYICVHGRLMGHHGWHSMVKNATVKSCACHFLYIVNVNSFCTRYLPI